MKKLSLKRSYILFIHDLSLSIISFVSAWIIRFVDQLEVIQWSIIPQITIEFAFVSFIVLLYSDIHKRSWRYSVEKDYLKLFQAAILINLVFFIGKFLLDRLENIPRSIFVINTILFSILLLSSRITYKYLIHIRSGQGNVFSVTRVPVLLAGVDDRAELFMRENSQTNFYNIVGVIDDNVSRKGSMIYGAEILGDLKGFKKVYNRLQKKQLLPRRIIISDKYSSKQYIDELSLLSEKYGIKLARLPKVTELDYSLIGSKNLKPIIIEDLLVRDQSLVGADSVYELVRGKTILVTGAGGTIGRELSRQISSSNPSKIILLENSEYNLYEVYEDIKKHYPNVKSEHYIADIRDKDLCDHIFKTTKPSIVFHAAALKHVPIVESNFSEGIKVNIFGTKNIADLAVEHDVESMVLISTDKAVDPSSVMGATKRAAEMYIKALGDSSKNTGTNFTAVRFGNVLGSSGSVIPLFKRQIAEGGPITVTDPKMKRYFMTVREAVKLVLQASAYSVKGSKKNSLYILDMGEQVYIKDLAKNMIEMAGLELGKDIEIEYTGLRPGEKLSEALFNKNEKYNKTESDLVFEVDQHDVDFIKMSKMFEKMLYSLKTKNISKSDSIKILQQIVVTYGRKTK
ncbi:MAG: polysaccharide biosynthesis protein [Alphaproteobacteria bacterium]|nr:polysaccharide biosynthesis protein [Alphaproteobacteria bacterium]